MHIVKKSLKPGGYFGSILPTTNQVIKLLMTLRQNDFAFVDVCDISLKYYKSEPFRFRPADRMIAHTGYLIFARSVNIDQSTVDQSLLDEIGLTDLTSKTKETFSMREKNWRNGRKFLFYRVAENEIFEDKQRIERTM